MIYKISQKLYDNLKNGVQDDKGNWIVKPLVTHKAVIEYLRQESGLKNITDVITD